MAKEYEIQVSSHHSIYGEKIKENHYGRNVTCYYNLPAKGIHRDTGILMLIAGFGAQASDKEYRNMRSYFADTYNLITIQCDYFGYEFMGDGKLLKKNILRHVLRDLFTEEEIDEIYQEEQLNFNTLLQIGSSKDKRIQVSIPEDLSDENLENFNDMGIMQAVDHLVCTSAVMRELEKKGKKFNQKKIIFYGKSHGAYLSYLCNALAPHFISLIIDYSATLKPVYLNLDRVLIYTQGNLTCELYFSYFAHKVYDHQLADLAFLYGKFENSCQILSYEMTKDKKEKQWFCRKIKNCRYQELSDPEEADFIKLFDKIMREKPVRLERNLLEKEQVISWETAKARYHIDYFAGLPYITVKKNKMGIEVQNLREKLFTGKMNEFHQILLDCLDQLSDLQNELTPKQLKIFQEAMENISIAMQDHDYLLVTDLLKFEILPCLNRKEGNQDRISESIDDIIE